MSASEDTYGSLKFFRKNGQPGTTYPLCTGITCIGSSDDADIRFKLKDERLEEVHCIIDVTNDGIATLVNKSATAPVLVNKICVRKFKVLSNEDTIDLLGKQFQYMNKNVSVKDVKKHQFLFNKAILSSKQRQSVAPIVDVQSPKLPPNVKTKTYVKKTPTHNRRHTVFAATATPENKPNTLALSNKSNTTSKIIASKALASPTRAKKRRLSLNTYTKKIDKKPKISARNLLLSQDIHSTISEELKPSKSLAKVGNMVADFLDVSNTSLTLTEDIPEQGMLIKPTIKTPSRSSLKVIEKTPGKTPQCTPSKAMKSKIMTPVQHTKVPKSTPSSVKAMRSKTLTPRINQEKTPKFTPMTERLKFAKAASESGETRLEKSLPYAFKPPADNQRESEDLISFLTPDKSARQQKAEMALSSSNNQNNSDQKILQMRRRNKSVESMQLPKNETLNRRKSEGYRLSINSEKENDYTNFSQTDAKISRRSLRRKSANTNADLLEDSVLVNLSNSSTVTIPLSSDVQIPSDPHWSLGKATPRKSVRLSRTVSLENFRKSLQRQAVRNSQIKHISMQDDLNDKGNSPFTKSNLVIHGNKLMDFDDNLSSDDLAVANATDTQDARSKRVSQGNVVEESSTVEVEEFQYRRRSRSSRLSFRKSNITETFKDGDEQFSGEGFLASPMQTSARITERSIQDESTFSVSSNDEYLDRRSINDSPKAQSVWHSSKMTGEESTSEETVRNSIFVPQRRPSLKRSYTTSKSESVESFEQTQSATPQGRSTISKKEAENIGTPDISSTSTVGATSLRRSRRKSICTYCDGCGKSPIAVDKTPPRRRSTKNNLTQSASSETDSVFSVDDDSVASSTPDPGVFLENADQSLNKSSQSKHSSRTRTSANKSYNSPMSTTQQNDSVMYVDSVVTPESNTSLIILDTPYQKPGRSSQRKLSKTLNSSIEDNVELTTPRTTPKHAVRTRRSLSLPYVPITEDITPVTPIEATAKNEGGFKTPLNTPGLFENIKNTVLKSRNRRKSGNNLMEEFNKVEVHKAAKRQRESTETSDRSPKKRRMASETTDTTMGSIDENLDASFESFDTDEMISDSQFTEPITPNTPQDFSNLTDKPVIFDPQTKSLTEPKKQKPASLRRSLQLSRLDSHSSENKMSLKTTSVSSTDMSFGSSDVITDDSSDSGRMASRKSRQSSNVEKENSQKESLYSVYDFPESSDGDLEKVVTKAKTPKKSTSPKNDFTYLKSVNRLMQTPRPVASPKNDLTNIIGVKKLFTSPKEVKSPKNDLRNVPNLRKIMYPRQQNSPKNDLSDVFGIKKLYSTQKKQNEPKNDLTNVAGIKKLMSSPRVQNSPKNDLSNIPNLRRVISPKQQNSPRNDLSDVRGVKRLMRTPRKQKQPLNDLSDVEGVAEIFTVPEVQGSGSDIENNEDLFDKLLVNKPVRTYRGKSLSPISRKVMLFGGNDRKSVGDKPYSSPRVEQWLNDQAVIELERLEENKIAVKDSGCENVETLHKVTPRGRRRKVIIATDSEAMAENKKTETPDKIELPKKITRSRRNVLSVDDNEERNSSEVSEIKEKGRGRKRINANEQVDSPQTTKGRPRRLASTPITGVVDSTSTDPESRPPTPLTRGRARKPLQNNASVEQIAIDTEFKPPTPATRGRPRKQPQNVEQIPQVHSTTEKSKPTGKPRTRKVWDKDNEDVNIGVSEIPSNEAPSALDHLHHLYDGAVEPKRTRGRKRKSVHLETLNDSVEKKVPAKRGRAKKATKTQEETLTVEENDKPSLAEPTTSDEVPLTEKLRRGNNTPDVQKTEDKSNGNDRKQTAKRNKRKIASNVVEVETKVNVRNRKKIVIEEDEEYYPEVHVNQPSNADLDEMPLIGRAGRRNNTNTPNVQETENKSSENETKQRVKGNKRKVAFDLDEAETKVNVRNRKKIVVEEDEEYYPEDESVRPTRGKAVLQEDDLNHTPTKVTRGRKKLTQPKNDAEEQVVKPARGRRTRKATDKKIEEDIPDKVTLDNDKESIPKEAPTRITRQKNKTVTFRKYGSEFVTDVDEDTYEEYGSNKKDIQPEEQGTRRSKRNRK